MLCFRESISTVLICCDAEDRLDRGRLYRKLKPAAAASVIKHTDNVESSVYNKNNMLFIDTENCIYLYT